MSLRHLPLLFPLLLALACSDSWSPTIYSLKQPTSVALACAIFPDDGSAPQPLDLGQCKKGVNPEATLRAFVGNSRLGSLSVLNLSRHRPVDTDKTIPGYTGLKLGENIVDVWARPDGKALLAAETSSASVFVVTLPEAEVSAQVPLPGTPLLFLDTGANPRLLTVEPAFLLELSADDGSILASTPLPDAPSDGAWDPAGQRILLTFRSLPRLQVLDAAGNLLQTISIGLPCADGLDNDGDGLVDAQQPSCWGDLRLARERALDCSGDCQLPACSNGLDDDGDGLVDAQDAGCALGDDSSEAEDLPPCDDGYDNDGDGATDGADPQCADGLDEAGQPVLQCPLGRTWFPCLDGLDNDADGSADHGADEGCLMAGFPTENGVPWPFARLALLPGGELAYVHHAGLGEILVVDLKAGEVLDLYKDLTRPGTFARREGRRGFAFPSPVTDLEANTLEDGSVEVLVLSSDGSLTALGALDAEGRQVHTQVLVDQDPDDSQVAKPHLFDNGLEIELGYTPRAGYPHFGPLTVQYNSDGSHTWYGIRLSEQILEHRSEVWTLAYEGSIPGTDSLSLRHRASGRFEVPGGRLCNLGVLAGDRLVLDLGDQRDFQGFLASRLELPILAVGSDWLETDLTEALAWNPLEEWVTALSPRPQTSPGAQAAAAVLSGALRGEILAGGTFLLTGSRSGLLHGVEEGPDGCRVRPAAGNGGRVGAPKVKADSSPASCPILEGDPAAVVTLHNNPVFNFRLYPACQVARDGSISAVPPARGMEWRFTLSSGFAWKRLLLGGLPFRLLRQPAVDLDLVVDPALLLLKALDLEDFSLDGYYY